ncbi:7eab8180-50c8-4b7c-9188-b8c7d34415db [Sclerotinia trifoliorum]|uniref:7eab8180-50c8-4b7c-9188-b8c7d34415db n=1 Tax=Sclerotinia trifoliorum TaxID=28548 RepID=A0A8H2ZK52_9HELO|nr:7eab8180-50c8-4b7c-9188-b8c7d34415db [Sclerotinia trifoliorum]
MDKIKAILHGTTPQHEKEVKEEKKAEKAEAKQEKKAEKIEEKEEKKAEKHGSLSHTGEGSHLGNDPHSTTHPTTNTTHTSNTSHTNPTPAGVSHTSGGLDQNNVGSHGNSHLGRDAALGSGAVGAAGLAEHEHRKHENTGLGSDQTRGHTEGSHGPHNSAALNAADPRVDSDLDGNRLPNKTSSGYGTKDAYDTNENGSSGHHLGRDAAALGAAGAVGEGIHHHNNHHNSQHGLGGSQGPHSTATANRLDPNLSSSGVPTEDAHTHHGHGAHSRLGVEGGGAEEADGVHGATSAGAGVVPVGAYESGHGHHTNAGPHSSNLANKADPRVDSDLSKQQNHHYGRDAAVAAGVGGAAYEANKHHHNSANTTTGPHSSKLENKVDPRVDSDLSKQNNHHYGRDTTVAGGLGGAAYEANKHHHNSANTTTGPHSSNLENKVDPRVDSDPSNEHNHHYGRDTTVAGGLGGAAYEANKHHHNSANTTTGPHSSNLENKVDPRVNSDNSREGHHYGRDAALAGGAATTAYEADKHHHNNANATTGPHSSNLENKVDPRVDSDRSREGHHYGRDAALAGGAAGTAYEVNKHHNAHGTEHKPVGKDIGDKLHGVERNRGVNGPTGFPHESGHRIAPGAVGTGVPGAPRGNVQDTHNTHGQHKSSSIDAPVHNSTGPDHIFTAPVMDDPTENLALREGKIDQHEHRRRDSENGRPHPDESTFATGGGYEHGKDRKLEHEINSAPLGNTATTHGSGLGENTYNTSSGSGLNHNNLTGHNTASSGTTGLKHDSGLTGHNTTGFNQGSSTGTTGLSHGSGLTGHNTTGLNQGSGLTGYDNTSTGTTGLSHGSGLTGHNTTGLNQGSGLTGYDNTSTGTTGLSHGSGLTGHNTTGLNQGSGLTGYDNTSTGTTGLSHASGLTGHNTTGFNQGSGLTGHHTTGLNHGSGLTGDNTKSAGNTGLGYDSGFTGNNTTSSGTSGLGYDSGLTGHNTTSLNHGSGLTGSTSTHGAYGENRLGETSEFGNTNTNSRVL